MKVDYMVAFSGIQKQQIIDKYGLDGGRTQKVIDSSIMGYMDKYMPADSMQMITSMYNSTKVRKWRNQYKCTICTLSTRGREIYRS